jgi:heme oxygenase
MYFHYCSVKTFKDFMKSQVLWLSDLTNSNDTQEVTRTFCNLWEAVKLRLLESDLDQDIIRQEIGILDQ